MYYDKGYNFIVPAEDYVYHQKLEKVPDQPYYVDHQNINIREVHKDARIEIKSKQVLSHGMQNTYLEKLENEAEVFVMNQRLYSNNPKKVFVPPIVIQCNFKFYLILAFGKRQTIDRLTSTCNKIVKRISKESENTNMYGHRTETN